MAGYNGWQPGDTAFEVAQEPRAWPWSAPFALWATVAMAAKRARDAHIPTLAFKAGLPAAVLFDHFAVARVTDERLVGPLSGITPMLALLFAGVFLLLLLAPRTPIQPLNGGRSRLPTSRRKRKRPRFPGGASI